VRKILYVISLSVSAQETSRRKVLECFLIDGRVEIDSNIVERAIRPQTITLFAGNDGGGRTWATIATLLQTAKMKRHRSANLARADAPAHRQRLAHLPDRKTHAMELQGLNGLCLALTPVRSRRETLFAVSNQAIRLEAIVCRAPHVLPCAGRFAPSSSEEAAAPAFHQASGGLSLTAGALPRWNGSSIIRCLAAASVTGIFNTRVITFLAPLGRPALGCFSPFSGTNSSTPL